MKKLILSLFFILLSYLSLSAQNIKVSGTVTAAFDSGPIPGVAVIVVDSSIYAMTDYDGHYTITCPSNATLTFIAIGFRTVTLDVQGRSIIDVCMELDNGFLEDSSQSNMYSIFQALLTRGERVFLRKE